MNQQKLTYKQDLQALYADIEQRFKRGDRGDDLVQAMSDGVDRILCNCWSDLAPNAATQIDLVAVGGYGRAELSVLSDWDIWLLVPEQMDDVLAEEMQAFLYALWDLGAKVGHAVRTVKESMEHIREDWQSATAALEMRLLSGSGQAFEALQSEFSRFLKQKKKAFVEAKLDEIEQRHQKTGNTAFLMEPDIKENRGGLRDVQSVFWMLKAWYGVDDYQQLVEIGAISQIECVNLLDAQHFLWRCRCGIHLERKRASDRLNYELQPLLAETMGFMQEQDRPAVEIFMKQYFRYAGRIQRVTGMLVMDLKERLNPKLFSLTRDIGDGFVLRGKQLSIRSELVFKEDPLRLLRIFHASQHGHRELSSRALRQVREDVLLIDDQFRANPEAHQTFLRILKNERNVAWALREMNNTGVLGRFIEPFRDVVGLGQFNRYHVYTVDEHTLRAVGEARNFYHGDHQVRLALAHEVWHKISRPELLYLALIFHDIAKGMMGDHSVNGETLARDFCRSIGLNQDATDLVAWLVRWHLHMAVVSQRSDLSDPEVIQEFASDVVDVERLNYLFLLTVADIAAVGPNVWNDWKGTLLSELYRSTMHLMMHGERRSEALDERIRVRRESVLERVEVARRPNVAMVLDMLPWRCLLHVPPRQLLPLAELINASEAGQRVEVYSNESRNETVVMIVAHDRIGLFAMITSSLATSHIQILSAQAYHLDDGRVLDLLYIQNQDGSMTLHESDQHRICQRIEGALAGEVTSPPAEVTKVNILMEKVPVRVRQLQMGSDDQTVIEVSAANRPGLLSRLLWVICGLGHDLRGASISTFGERVVDVFFVRNSEGNAALTDEEVVILKGKLLEIARLPEGAEG